MLKREWPQSAIMPKKFDFYTVSIFSKLDGKLCNGGETNSVLLGGKFLALYEELLPGLE
jgi:hypothetical protein